MGKEKEQIEFPDIPPRQVLFENALFDGVDAALLDELWDAVSLIKGERETVIFHQHERPNGIFFLLEGEVKVGRIAFEDRELIRRFVFPGTVFGEAALGSTFERHEYAVIISPEGLIAGVSLDKVHLLMADSPQFGRNVVTFLADRASEDLSAFEYMRSTKAEQRIHAFFVMLMEKKGRWVGTEIVIDHPYRHHEIAIFTNSSRQTVTTLIGKYRRAGLIYIDRRRLLIREKERFYKFINI